MEEAADRDTITIELIHHLFHAQITAEIQDKVLRLEAQVIPVVRVIPAEAAEAADRPGETDNII